MYPGHRADNFVPRRWNDPKTTSSRAPDLTTFAWPEVRAPGAHGYGVITIESMIAWAAATPAADVPA